MKKDFDIRDEGRNAIVPKAQKVGKRIDLFIMA